MDFWQIIMTPFSWLLKVFCQIFDSYGLALILFTIVIKIILFPLSLKGKQSMIKMNLAQADLKEIQKRCGNDKQRYNEEVQQYYADHEISPTGGCGWSLIPLLILWPLYAIIRRPMKYMMRLTEDGVAAIGKVLGVDVAASRGYGELLMSSAINGGNLESVKAAATAAGATATSIFVINFKFLGIDLSQIPTLKFWENGISWGSIGLFLLPVVSAALSVVSMIVSQKTNRMSASDPTSNATSRSMMIFSPLMSLWIGFTLPAGLCVYWIANSLLMMVQEVLCGKILKKDYEKARAEMAEQARKAKEAEKERRREAAERKAAAIAANKGKAKKPQTERKDKGVDLSASREGIRAYARGRAYDPNRYPITEYHDRSKKTVTEPELEPLTEEEKALLAESGIEVPTEEVVDEVVTAEETVVTESADYEEPYAEEAEDETKE